jgi:hypothetical protein
MGLDNIPNKYPCKTQGTAIITPRLNKEGNPILEDDGTPMTAIDCQATQANGGCPYKNDYEKSGLTGGSVLGMFGTDCWYRGKYGNYLVEELGIYDETEGLSFYGALGDNSHKSPHECNILADAMEKGLETYDGEGEEADDVRQSIAYAIWYLRWAAVTTEGLDCWY